MLMPREYIEIRFHGRAGQGIVTASQLLSASFFLEGKYPQSVPIYGPQRRGAPVTVFLRVGDEKIRLRSWIEKPQYVVLLDATLAQMVNVTDGLRPGGTILVNSASTGATFEVNPIFRLAGVPADEIAYEFGLGSAPYPNINTLVLAAFSKVTGLVSLESLIHVAKEAFPPKDDRMEQGMRKAYELAWESTGVEQLASEGSE
jgi:2-oxoacid:acceptor oxidoreductase gamma subunit (pyruvate/2-ketoisovalerate family)